MNRWIKAVLIVALSFSSLAVFGADKYSGTPAARAAYNAGKQAWNTGKFADAVADYEKAIQLDPNFVTPYSDLLFAQTVAATGRPGISTSKSEQEVARKKADAVQAAYKAKYEALARENPKNPIYPWALSRIYYESDPKLQEMYCRKAISLDKDFTPAYECLADIAGLAGDYVQAAAYYRPVLAANPDNAEMMSHYIYYLQNNPKQYKNAVEEMVKKFSESPETAMALNWYAYSLDDPVAQEAVFEELVNLFPPARFDYSRSAAQGLFADYDQTDPAKARALAQEMLKQFPKDGTWKNYAAYAHAMASAEEKLASGDNAAALDALKSIKIASMGRAFGKTRFQLLEARAAASGGKAIDGYDSLFSDVAAHPGPETLAALYEYGQKAGKNKQQVDAELWKARSATALPEIPFTLTNLATGKKVSLSDYRGHVVILDFFFPNCGPCRSSYPYLKKLHDHFKSQGVELLAVNGVDGQAPFVLPMMKNLGLDFTPLEGGQKFCSKVYHVRAFPTTLLIGADGRIYFAKERVLPDGSKLMEPHVWNTDGARTMELEIEALLDAAGTTPGKVAE